MIIVATISKNSYAPEKIKEIIIAGADFLRFNFSHGTPKENVKKIQIARQVISELNTDTKIIADLPGAKVRLGTFLEKIIEVNKGDEYIFRSEIQNKEQSVKEGIPVNFENLGNYVKEGQIIPLADGEIAFKVIKIIDNSAILMKALVCGQLKSLKGIHLGHVIDELDHCTEITRSAIKVLPEIKPEYVAFSFVNSSSILNEYKSLLSEVITQTWQPEIISKLESLQAIEKLDEIIDTTDWIMVARGDLGLNIPLDQVGLVQKQMVKRTKEKGKKSIVATQILESSIDHYIPKRSDILDLTNIVLDGADGIMLCQETGLGSNPGRSVAIAKDIISTVANI